MYLPPSQGTYVALPLPGLTRDSACDQQDTHIALSPSQGVRVARSLPGPRRGNKARVYVALLFPEPLYTRRCRGVVGDAWGDADAGVVAPVLVPRCLGVRVALNSHRAGGRCTVNLQSAMELAADR